MTHKKDITLLLSSAFIWGTSFPIIEWNIKFLGVNFYFFLLFRFFLAFLVSIFLILIFKRGLHFISSLKQFKIILLAILNVFAFIFQFYGQNFTTAGKSSLLINLNIIFVPLLTITIFKEKLNKFKLISIISGIFGVYFLTVGFRINELFLGNIIGDLFCLFAGIIWSVYIILSKKVLTEKKSELYSYLDITNSINFYTFIFLLTPLFLFYLNYPNMFSISYPLYILISELHLGINCTFLALLMFNKGLKNKSPTIVSITLLLEIIVANLLGAIFLPSKSYFSIDFLIGALLIIFALIIGNI